MSRPSVAEKCASRPHHFSRIDRHESTAAENESGQPKVERNTAHSISDCITDIFSIILASSLPTLNTVPQQYAYNCPYR